MDRISKVDQLRRWAQVDVREVWPSEPRDFTPWLSRNLDLLEIKELGVLELEGIEVQVGSRYLDILARASSGVHIAIENQFGRTDHDHLTRGLSYAVGKNAQYLVVISEEHREEFQNVATHINTESQNSNNRIGIFLVEFTVMKVENFYVPSFNVVCKPDWGISNAPSDGAESMQNIEQFYTMLAENASAKVSTFRGIISNFCQRPDCFESHASKSTVALFMKNPVTGKNSCLIQLDTKGRIFLCRGYILDLEPFADPEVRERLDQNIARIFGEIKTTPKNFYPNVSNASVAQIEEFVDLIAKEFQLFKHKS